MFRQSSLAALFVLLTLGCTTPVRFLSVLHTTDVHGSYSSTRSAGARGFGALVDRLEEEGRPVLVLDSGDMWSGTLLSDRSEGALGLAIFEALGVHAAALGNHEFDYGPVGLEWGPTDDPSSALRQRLSEAPFPILAANLLDRSTGLYPDWQGLAPSASFEVGGIRVGVVGAITPTTPEITFPWVGEQLSFLPVLASVEREARQLRADGAELVFVIGHLGAECSDLSDPDDLSSCDPHSEAFALARALPSGLVDAIFGGHTHQRVGHRVADVPILHGGCYYRESARLDVQLAAGRAPVLDIRLPETLVDERGGARRAAVDAILLPAEDAVRALRESETGLVLTEALGRSRQQSSPLGDVLCDELMALYPEADICILNSGGLRDDLASGPVTYGELYDVLPFGNAVAVVEVEGALLTELLRVGVSGAHGVPQVAGLSLSYDRGLDPCPVRDTDGDGDVDAADRDRLEETVLDSGEALDPNATYTLVTNSFLAAGGDGWRPIISRLSSQAIHVLFERGALRDQLADSWRANPRTLRLPAADGPPRVRALGSEPQEACRE